MNFITHCSYDVFSLILRHAYPLDRSELHKSKNNCNASTICLLVTSRTNSFSNFHSKSPTRSVNISDQRATEKLLLVFHKLLLLQKSTLSHRGLRDNSLFSLFLVYECLHKVKVVWCYRRADNKRKWNEKKKFVDIYYWNKHVIFWERAGEHYENEWSSLYLAVMQYDIELHPNVSLFVFTMYKWATTNDDFQGVNFHCFNLYNVRRKVTKCKRTQQNPFQMSAQSISGKFEKRFRSFSMNMNRKFTSTRC